jgi:hypothetical protein
MNYNKAIEMYLDSLRNSGITNMMSAAPFLENEFGMSNADAKKCLSQWMSEFKGDE